MKPLQDSEVLAILQSFDLINDVSDSDRALLASLSEGSVRRAITLVQKDGLTLYRSFNEISQNLDNLNWPEIQKLADGITARGKEDKYGLFLNFANNFMQANARGNPEQKSSISSLARWAQVWEKTQKSVRTAESYNLDRKQVILNLFYDMGETTRN